MTTTTVSPPSRGIATERRRAYGPHIFGVLLAAFSLSVVHTVYAWLAGIEDPGFTVTTPVTWIFYTVAFAVTVLARRDQRWAQITVVAFLVLVLLIGVFYYPTTFGPRQQTVFGWFENDVYLGLLTVGLYLGVLRLRGVTLVP